MEYKYLLDIGDFYDKNKLYKKSNLLNKLILKMSELKINSETLILDLYDNTIENDFDNNNIFLNIIKNTDFGSVKQNLISSNSLNATRSLRLALSEIINNDDFNYIEGLPYIEKLLRNEIKTKDDAINSIIALLNLNHLNLENKKVYSPLQRYLEVFLGSLKSE